MSSKRGHFKDRILEGIAKAIKEVQSFSYGVDGEVLKVTNDDRPLQKLVERLDHAFLHGLKNVTRGYWGVTKLFAHRGIIDEITNLDRLTTDLGRSRAWLYKSLNETALESYLRCFLENPITMRKYYVETGMLRDKQRLMVLQTLISGLDFVTFDLELNIAYFDLVSYIPRSASISEHEDDTPTNGVPTTPSTPAMNPDNDGNSSIASSDAFSPMDESPQADLLLKDKMKRIEKRHSLPQHYSEIDLSDLALAGTTDQEDGRDGVDGRVYQRSDSVGKIGEGKPIRPASLGITSRNEVKFLGEDSSPRGSLKSLEDDQRDGDLEVIRVKSKKVKKGQKKKKKTDRSSLDGDSQSIISASSSTVCDDDETNSQDQLLSKSCSVSSFQSSSDGALLNQQPNPKEIDHSDSSAKNIKKNGVLENTEYLSNLKHTSDSDEKTKRLQKRDHQEGSQQHLIEDNLTEKSQVSSDFQPTCDSNINDSANLARDLPKLERPQITHQPLTSKSSLDFDETVQLTLSSPKSIKVIRSSSELLDAPQPMESVQEKHSDLSQSEDPDVSWSQSVLLDEVPSFASLFAKTTSQTPWVTDDHQSSAESSLLSTSDISADQSEKGSNEMDGCQGKQMRAPSDTGSFKEEYDEERSDDVTKGTVTKAISMETDSHEAEIIVDNNLKLYLMLEIFKNEHEQFKKLIRMSTGHMEGDLQPAFILLTDHTLYILRRGEKQGHYSTQYRLPYTTLDYISVGLHYQTVQIVCTNRRRQYWLTTGDESLTRFFLSSLRRVMDATKQSTEPISILTDATAQVITLKKWAAQECKTEIHDIKLHLYSLIHWEDLADLSMTPDLQLYEPQISRKGSLKYKVSGSFLVGIHWKSGWFVLRNEMFCRYSQKEDRQPDLSVQLRAPHFGGCRRVRNGDRPHSFELILSDGASLELSCDTEEEVSDWLQTICQVVAQGQIAATRPTHAPSPCQPCCVVTTSHKLLICHEDCQTNFYRLLATADVHDVTQLTTDHEDGAYIIVEFLSEHPQNPWVFYFNSVNEKVKFVTSLSTVWKQIMQVDLPIIPISDSRVQKRCQECSALIQSSWQRSDSLMRGRVGGNIW